MKVYVLFGQRKERYPGEYAPEALAVIDEWGDEDNPDYMAEERQKAIDSKDFENVVILTLKINGVQLMELLRPSVAEMDATILEKQQ